MIVVTLDDIITIATIVVGIVLAVVATWNRRANDE